MSRTSIIQGHTVSVQSPVSTPTEIRPLPPDLHLGQVLCFKHKRRVARDNTVKFQRHTLQLLPDRHRRSYAGAAVVVLHGLDGRLSLQGAEPSVPAFRGGLIRDCASNRPLLILAVLLQIAPTVKIKCAPRPRSILRPSRTVARSVVPSAGSPFHVRRLSNWRPAPRQSRAILGQK